MIIRLNGGLSISENDYYFDELEVEIIDEELDMPFDFLVDDEEEYCDCDCEYCDDDEDELDDNMDALLEMYTDILSEGYCHEHIRVVLLDLIKDFVDILVE